jgi:hypothetical protein
MVWNRCCVTEDMALNDHVDRMKNGNWRPDTITSVQGERVEKEQQESGIRFLDRYRRVSLLTQGIVTIPEAL